MYYKSFVHLQTRKKSLSFLKNIYCMYGNCTRATPPCCGWLFDTTGPSKQDSAHNHLLAGKICELTKQCSAEHDIMPDCQTESSRFFYINMSIWVSFIHKYPSERSHSSSWLVSFDIYNFYADNSLWSSCDGVRLSVHLYITADKINLSSHKWGLEDLCRLFFSFPLREDSVSLHRYCP